MKTLIRTPFALGLIALFVLGLTVLPLNAYAEGPALHEPGEAPLSLGGLPEGSIVKVANLQTSWDAPGGGGVYAAYYGPPGYLPVSPGTTSVYYGVEAGIIKAGITPDPVDGHYWDEGLLGFQVPNVGIGDFASQALSFDVQNETGTNPVWVRIRLVDGTTYQHLPTSNPMAWHTVDAAAGQWQLMDSNGNGVGPLMSLAELAVAVPSAVVDRVYLTLGMGDSYNVAPGVGTVGWVDKVTIDTLTYDFVVMPPTCTTDCYVDATVGDDSLPGTLEFPMKTIQKGIDTVQAGGKVHVAAGIYEESKGSWRDMEMSKSLSLIGAGSGSTFVKFSNLQHGLEVRGTAEGVDVLIQGIAFTKRDANANSAGWAVIVAETGGKFNSLVFRDVEIAYASARNLALLNATYTSITLDGVNVHHATNTSSPVWGMSARGTISGLAITDSHFDYNVGGPGGYGIGLDIDMPTLADNIHVSNSTFNYNNAKGLNLVKTTNAVFDTIEAKGNWAGGANLGIGVCLWEWMGASSNLQFLNSAIEDNGLDGILFGTDSSSLTISNVTIDNCSIKNNVRGGIFIWTPGFSPVSNMTVSHSRIQGNGVGFYTTSAQVGDSDFNAEENWWGHATGADHSTNPHGTGSGGDTVTDYVDFTPWYATATTTPLTEHVTVTHNPVIALSDTIQGAVDAALPGDTLDVADGVYEEAVVIAKDLTLQGASTAAVVMSPGIIPTCFTTSAAQKPIVCIKDGATVTLDRFTIDGAGLGNANNRFSGVAFRNAGGTVKNCVIKDIRDTPFSGAQHGVAIYAYNTDEIGRTLTVWDTEVYGFQKNAMALNAGDTTPLVVDVRRNEVTGAGATTITAQNGIQVWAALGTGVVDSNTVSGIAYDNTSNPTKYVATSILPYYSDLTITGNTITGAHMGIYNVDGAAVMQNNNLTINKVGVSAYGIVATDPSDAVPSPFGEGAGGEGSGAAARTLGTISVDASYNTVTLSGADNTSTYGIEFDAGYGPADLVGTAHHNTVTGFEAGIEVWQCTTGCDTGVFLSVTAHDNCLSSNSYGMRSNASYLTVDGTSNWWGAATGPYHAVKNAAGLGDDVSDYIDFEPWVTDGCGGSTTTGHWLNLRTGAFDGLAGSLAAAATGDTIQGVCSGLTPIPGGGTAAVPNVTIDLNGCVAGPGSSFVTVTANDVTVRGPGVLDGAGSADPAIVVKAGAGNFILQGVEVRGWGDGVFLEGSVISFKMGENFIHDNTGAALHVGTGVTLGGVVTIEGNLFKDNGGPGVVNDGATVPLIATYNSWGDLAGPAGPLGDGVGSNVTYEPWTFAELFLDLAPDTEAIERHVVEATGFDIKLKADAAKLYGITFVFTYDTAKLTLNTTTFAAPWVGRCNAIPDLPEGTIGYFCSLQNEVPPDPEWDADGGTIATFHFTAFMGTPGNGPWTALFDIAHLEVDTNASAIGGQKVFVNNAGFNDPTIPDRDITDIGLDDGRIIIERLANFTGYVDLQGRLNDSLAAVRVYNQAPKNGAVELSNGTSASSGAYTTVAIAPYWLGLGNTYYLAVDRWLYLPTTPLASLSFYNSRLLDGVPSTPLPKAFLLGGDATNNEIVDIGDLSCIGGDYNRRSGFNLCGGTGLSDVNEDHWVNVQDLSMAGGNLYKEFSPWTVP